MRRRHAAIGDDIEALQKAGQRLDGIAILVRASFQMRAFEDRFVTLGLPYRVVGGPRFYERQEIKDAIAYLEVTLNPANDLKFERIVNVPKRGLGDTTLRRIHELARARAGVPLYQAAREIVETEELTGRARKSLADLIASFERWRGSIEGMKHTELAELILDESGYTQMWQQDRSPQAQSRLENLKELIRFMHEFETLQGFLEHVALVMDADAADGEERVSLMTLHAAKGLEFDVVFLPGWEEGLFPHQRSLDESGTAGLEEERRLAYVGLTRAKRKAKVSFAQNRRNRGLWQAAAPSRFVDELPEKHVEVVATRGQYGGGGPVQSLRAQPFRRSGRRLCQRICDAGLAAGQGAVGPPPQVPRPADARWGAGGLLDKSRVGLRAGRAGVPPEVRLRPRSPRWRATSSPSTSTRPGASGWWTALSPVPTRCDAPVVWSLGSRLATWCRRERTGARPRVNRSTS